MYQPPRLRLALGLGDQELEQRLRPALDDAEDLAVVAQCLAADQLLQAVESRQVDAAVVAWSLHRLTDTLLEQIERTGLPIVLLVPDPEAQRWATRRGPLLPVDAPPLAVRQALQTASRRGERVLSRPRPSTEPLVRKAADLPENHPAGVIAVGGGAGSPGRTTVAINLATALGTAAPTVLVEADLCAPSLAAYLDRDPSRNVCTLAHAVRENPHAWDAALVDELQPLSRHCAMGVALCGPPKREMRASIAPAFFERLVGELAQRYRYIVLDVGPELLGIETAAANHRAALDERVVTVEEVPELLLDRQLPDCVALQVRGKNVEGVGEISIRDLVRNALRMRPTRIVVGEVRGAEALDMLLAMNTGHDGSLTTIHGNSPRDALDRLATLAMMAGERLVGEELVRMVSRTIELVVQLRVTTRTGQRRVASIFEVTGVESGVISGHEIWGLEHGRLVWKGRPPRCLEKIAAQGIEYAPPLGVAAEGLA